MLWAHSVIPGRYSFFSRSHFSYQFCASPDGEYLVWVTSGICSWVESCSCSSFPRSWLWVANPFLAQAPGQPCEVQSLSPIRCDGEAATHSFRILMLQRLFFKTLLQFILALCSRLTWCL